jgi:FHA domain
MTGLTVTVMKLGLLAILWVFVLLALGVVRSDLFGAGARAGRGRSQAKQAPAAAPVGSASGITAPANRPRRGVPTRLEDDFASSHHARIYPDATGQWIVEDLGSTNGTYLDRTKLNAPTPVPLGVPIRIGKTALELKK